MLFLTSTVFHNLNIFLKFEFSFPFELETLEVTLHVRIFNNYSMGAQLFHEMIDSQRGATRLVGYLSSHIQQARVE